MEGTQNRQVPDHSAPVLSTHCGPQRLVFVTERVLLLNTSAHCAGPVVTKYAMVWFFYRKNKNYRKLLNFVQLQKRRRMGSQQKGEFKKEDWHFPSSKRVMHYTIYLLTQ